MKRLVAFGLAFLLSIAVVSALSCTTNEDCDDGILWTDDYCSTFSTNPQCYNQKTATAYLGYLIMEILGDIKDNLTGMATSLENIENKDCKWENLNQRQDLYSSANFGGGWNFLEGDFYVPISIPYSEVRVLGARAELEATYSEHGAFFFINEVNCGPIPSGKSNIYEFSEDCINSLVSGKNVLKIQVPSNSFAEIHTVWLEMEVKPANC